jgi:uncharacterized membrane protein
MTWYTFFKAVHVTAAAIWVGGAAMIQALSLRIGRSADPARRAGFAKDAEVVGMRTFIPATAILLLAGIAMMINLDWPWDANWIVLGLVAFTISFVVGAGYLGPESGRIAAVIERDGPESPEAQVRIRRILLVGRCELVVLVTVLVNMVVKPTGNAGWFWGLLAFMAVGIAVVAAASLRGGEEAPAPAEQGAGG